MKPLRESWQGAERWVDRFNALRAAGHANACPDVLRSELDGLLADIVAHHHNKAAARALRNLQGGTPQPAAIAHDMVRLHDWIRTR